MSPRPTSAAAVGAATAAALAAATPRSNRPIDLIRFEMDRSLIERTKEVELLLLGLLSQQNVLLIGPPGTGKSYMCHNLARTVDLKYFAACMNKYTAPEELYGPFSMKALDEDRFERVVDGYLPTAQIAFLDEIFKGSSACNNTLLTLLNERHMRNGTAVLDCPLMTAFAGSNEWPIGEGFSEQGAFFDRFLIRHEVRPVSSIGRQKLLWGSLPDVKQVATQAQIEEAQREVLAMPVSEDAKESFVKILSALTAEKISVGDRRLRQSTSVVKAYAYLEGATEVQTPHLACLSEILWGAPEQYPNARKAIMTIANPAAERVVELVAAAGAAAAEAKDFSTAYAQMKKLDKIHKDLGALGTHLPDVKQAMEHVHALRLDIAEKHLGNS